MFSIRPKIELEYYVVFDYSIRRHLFSRWLKKGFGHCYCMKKSEGGLFWIITNPMISHVDTDYRTIEAFPSPRDYAGDQATIIKVKVFVDPLANSLQFGIITCVDIVKRYLGIKSWLVWTPHQLFKYLRKRHGGHI